MPQGGRPVLRGSPQSGAICIRKCPKGSACERRGQGRSVPCLLFGFDGRVLAMPVVLQSHYLWVCARMGVVLAVLFGLPAWAARKLRSGLNGRVESDRSMAIFSYLLACVIVGVWSPTIVSIVTIASSNIDHATGWVAN